jgi:diaminopimelate decarboxylase
LGRKAKVSFRINPAVSPKTHPHLATGLRESKFGIQQREALSAYKMAKDSKYFSIEGIHMHIGSQILETEVYAEAVSKLMETVCKLKKELNIDLKFIDVGGGFGIKYKKDDRYLTASEFADVIFPNIDKAVNECNLKRPEIFIEPGRYLVGDSTILLTKVLTLKETPYRKFVGVDSGFNTLSRPILYGAHHDVLVANKMREEAKEVVTIAGNVCESGDILAHDRNLPMTEEGDIIAILDAGAYGLAMASQYNLRPRPAAVLVSNGRWIIMRVRETFNDVIASEKLPEELRD